MSGKYNAGRSAFADGQISWTKDRILAQLVSGEYVFQPRHQALAEIQGKLGEPVELKRKAVEAGWCKADSIVFKQVSGLDAVAIVIYRAAAGARDTLIAHHNEITAFPMRLNGGDVIVDVPAQGLFRV